jgi:biopolymer transport protein ExbD
MNWKVRHEGSPEVVEATLPELLEQLGDGAWEPTDEVCAPGEAEWQAIENHPATAEIAADLEPPPARIYDDETRLDMNAMIDVTLVLLVFFILTTSVAALQKRLEAPSPGDDKSGVLVVTEKDVANLMIHVKVSLEDGEPVYRIQDRVVDPVRLVAELQKFVRSSKKTILLLEHTDDVPQDSVVKVIDAAKGAGMDRVRLRVP